MLVVCRVTFDDGTSTLVRETIISGQTSFTVGPFANKPTEFVFNEFFWCSATSKYGQRSKMLLPIVETSRCTRPFEAGVLTYKNQKEMLSCNSFSLWEKVPEGRMRGLNWVSSSISPFSPTCAEQSR